MRVWLYRIQHRLALTRNESVALLTLAGLFLAGMGAQAYRQHNTPPLPPALQAESAVPVDSAARAAFAPLDPEPAIINVNAASVERLQDLPGIGPALSKRIEAYRARQPFQAVDELESVRGIGPKTMEALRPLVTVTEATDSPTSTDAADGEAPSSP